MSLAGILSNEKLIETRLGNKLGLQVGRVLAARLMLHLRRALRGSCPPDVAPYVAKLKRDGFCLIPDFLPEDVFRAVRQEFEQANNDATWTDATTFVDVRRLAMTAARINTKTAQDCPETMKWVFGDCRWRDIFAAHEGCDRGRLDDLDRLEARFEHIVPTDEAPPEEKDYSTCFVHSDSFFSITKAFYYLRDSDEHSGAFRFAPGSHRLTLARLAFEYANSNGRFERSPRPTDDELAQMGCRMESLDCRANSLMIANPFGFHARGEFDQGTQRNTVYWEFRSLPFRM